MQGCKVYSKDDFIKEIINICDESSILGDIQEVSLGLKQRVKDLIDIARSTSDPEQQLGMLREALDEFYNSPEDDYGQFLGDMLPRGHADLLFNTNYDNTLDEKPVPSFGGAGKSSVILRKRNFITSKFPKASNAKLYFQRSIRNDMVETFLVSRSSDDAKYFTTQEDMNLNVRAYKQQLLDRIFEYFDSNAFTKDLVKDLPRKMYIDGKYTGVIEKIKAVIDSRLSPELFVEGVQPLDTYYKEYRDNNNKTVQKNAERLLNAYNAWITIQHFDTIVQDVFGSIIKVNPGQSLHDHDLTKYEIKTRATNMWNNWGDSDDIADMSEVISEVTQALVETSRMYKWGNAEAFPDRYVSFHDFNYAIGWIKKQAFNPENDNILLNELVWTHPASPYTKRVMSEILNWNRINGNFKTTPDGKILPIPKEVTWKQLVSRINENPQRYMHVIFDILCNTNILEHNNFKKEGYTISDYAKNLIWSFHKEIFGGDGNQRSLYRLHTATKQDNVYQILTQVAASTFPEDYLQYYEKADGSIGTRLLNDYAMDNIKNALFQNIQQTAVTLSKDQYSKYGITYTDRPGQPLYLGEIKISIPIDNQLTFTLTATSDKVYLEKYTPEQMNLIWESPKFQKLIKDILGVDFIGDPDLKNAYCELLKTSTLRINDLKDILGRVAYSAIVNNEYTAKHARADKDESVLKTFLKNQFGSASSKYEPKVDRDTGLIPVLPIDVKDAYLSKLAMATAINNNLLAAAQSKTGEGTSLANYTLSRMRNFYQNQIEMQCKKANSATKDLSFVVNSNGLFEGILSRRELKTQDSNQQSTKFSDKQSFQLSFVSDFLPAFVPKVDSKDYIKHGKVSFLPTVNSDKSQIDGLVVNLYAKSSIPNGKGGFKTYAELTDSEIEQEMMREFKPMYDRIITNINSELAKVCKISGLVDPSVLVGKSVIIQNQILLNAINTAFANRTDLGSKPKSRIIEGLHRLITEYNKTHSRNPIMLSEHVHYTFTKDGLLTSNKTLDSLWGRFNPEMDAETRNYIETLYANEFEYKDILTRSGLSDILNIQSFFKRQDYLTVKDLLDMKFDVTLYGSNEMVRDNQEEIQFLRGDAKFTDSQLKDPQYAHMIALNNEMKNWVSDNGKMIIAKGLINGVLTNITTHEQLAQATNLQLHPMLSKLNRLDYLCTQQYTVSTVGSHYVHKGGAKEGSILVEEAKRWLASNKRNVAATSTVHLFQNKQLDGAPSIYNVAILEDVSFDLYNVMGDLYLEGHKPLDGGMFVNAWMTYLENNSLAGECAGLDKKQFGTFYSELYGAGGIVKTAGFAATNARMRRQRAWRNLQRNMSSRKWVKEYAGEDGSDINEVIDITRDYLGNTIDYTQAIKGQKIMYKRPAHDNPKEFAAYRLVGIKSLGNNQYEISEVEINQYGVESGEVNTRVETIDNNWDLFTKVFGGEYSLEIGSDNKLTWSENSNKLMVHAINNVGYKKANAVEGENGLDQDDVWQPLKYSDIHYTPNIGAIKSLQFNVNPDGKLALEQETTLNAMAMRLAQLGIQLDKEHHADASDVSMPTQIIQAMSNRSFTSEYSKEAYEALAILTRQATKEFLDGVQDIITGEDPEKLTVAVTNLILDNLLHQSSEDSSVNAILNNLLEKAEKGKEIKFADDIKGKVPWSDPTINAKLFASLSTTLTNIAVKMKFAGTLSVICPTDPVERIYGDRMLNSFTQIATEDGSTRTALGADNLAAYQTSVREGNEVDSDGRNMLIFDSVRDEIEFPPMGTTESPEEYQKRIRRDTRRKKLSLVSELKTQHNYVIEFADGTKEEVTINTPKDYYKVKNFALFGKDQHLIEPFNYDEAVARYEKDSGIIEIASSDRMALIYEALSKPVLTQESVMNETGFGREEISKLFGLFKSAQNGGVSVERLAEMIYQANPELFEDDYEVRSLIIDAIGSARTTGDFKGYVKKRTREIAEEWATKEYNEYAYEIAQTYNMSVEEYEAKYESVKNGNYVTKIYENVEKGRALGAYNVRFSGVLQNSSGLSEEYRYQIFDLDSVNFLFKLNDLWTDEKKPIKGVELFQKRNSDQQQKIIDGLVASPIFKMIGNSVVTKMIKMYPNLPILDSNFISNLDQIYPERKVEIISALYRAIKPRAHKIMQQDLFKLSDNFKGKDRSVFVNGQRVTPENIQTDAYELIMPQIYKTVFGLQEYDDLQQILRDEEFFLKRGLERFKCKLAHTDYDYELKNFNGEHVYILDKSKGIPEHLQEGHIFQEERRGKLYRVDGDGHIMYEMSSKEDRVCKIGDVQIIVTDNPLFYINTMNYNTLKVSPKRVTQESYETLIGALEESTRKNSKNFLTAIKNANGNYFDLKTFKEFNTELDSLTYQTVKDNGEFKDFKSIAQICKIIIKNGKELHTAFKESLNLVAGRIPAQSQQSFMTQKVIAFDNSGLNTAMVSTFQLFLQGSDLDIDAVTLLGYEFDKNGKFVGWSPYFDSSSTEFLKASKKLPMPTGESIEINASENATNNFFEVYDKYFGTLFKTIKLPTGENKYKTKNGVLELRLDLDTPQGMELFAQFLRDVKEYGISIKAPVENGVVVTTDENFFNESLNLFRRPSEGGLIGARPDQVYAMAQQLLDFVNNHNKYLKDADEHLQDKMVKNYIVHYIYKCAESPCNQTEAMKSVDESTRVLKDGAADFAEKSGEASHAPGRVTSKVKMIGEGQAGKDGVGIGAVGIKANSTTQFYISELWNSGSDWDREKILFKVPVRINNKTYNGFANMYTTKEFSDVERKNLETALSVLNSLESEDQITTDVAEQIAAMLSIAVDNAKDLALAKINSGPRLMGMYVYGMTLGIPTQELIKLMTSEQGLILKELTEGSKFSNDPMAFKILDAFDKIEGNIGGDLARFKYRSTRANGKNVSVDSGLIILGKMYQIKDTQEALFAAMYPEYEKWFKKNGEKLPKMNGMPVMKATDFNYMMRQLIYYSNTTKTFSSILQKSKTRLNAIATKIKEESTPESYRNWLAATKQMVEYLEDMEVKRMKFSERGESGSIIGNDLKTLAEGAEEMRILGSILSINKGLKATISEAETFIDTIENLIYNRKKIKGIDPKESDKIDFVRFMLDEEYQKEKIDEYEKVKHSVNILHLITKAPHFFGYLKTEVIPTAFFTTASIKYRTLKKYRQNVSRDTEDAKPVSIFNFFGVDSKREKEQILKGLENLIQYKLFTGWTSSKNLTFKVPAGFKYFTDKGKTQSSTTPVEIPLYTEAGLATFKKYMEEVYIPMLKDDPSLQNNAFIRNLMKISYNKTPVHSSVITYSLQGDLMARKGRQAELNAEMFADFQSLAHIKFQPEMGIPSLIDAFYLYAQYCYMGKKGQKSLMTLFDSVNVSTEFTKGFNNYVAEMDVDGSMHVTKEELIIWCAPYGSQNLKSKWAYVNSYGKFGISLRRRLEENVKVTEENVEAIEAQKAAQEDAMEEAGFVRKSYDKFGVYKSDYESSQYDRLTKNHFLVPMTSDLDLRQVEVPLVIDGTKISAYLTVQADRIIDVAFSSQLVSMLEAQLQDGSSTEVVKALEQKLKDGLTSFHVPYKVSLYSDNKMQVDFGILQTIIEQLINC